MEKEQNTKKKSNSCDEMMNKERWVFFFSFLVFVLLRFYFPLPLFLPFFFLLLSEQPSVQPVLFQVQQMVVKVAHFVDKAFRDSLHKELGALFSSGAAEEL